MAICYRQPVFVMTMAVVLCFCSGQTVRWCTISSTEQSKCNDMAEKFNDELRCDVQCVPKTSHLDCMKAIAGDNADMVTLDGGDIYIAGKDYDMKPVVAEQYDTGDFSYYAVAVAKADSGITFDKLEGKKSCHTGIGKTSGWNIPIGTLIENKYIEIEKDVCDVPQAVGDFFYQSCAPGAKDPTYDPDGDNPDSLCELCIGDGVSKCARSQVEPYYDYSGAFRCLAEGAGEVAFIKHTTVLSNTDGNTPPEWGTDYKSSDFMLLCANGRTEPDVSKYTGCNLALVPSHGVMTSGEKTSEYVDYVAELLFSAQDVFGSDENTNGFKMFDSSDYGGADLLFKDSTVELVTVGNKDTYEEFLGTDYLEAIKAINCDNGAGLLRGSLTLMVLLVLIVLGLK